VRGCTAMMLPLAVMPDRPKSVIAFDLSTDPSPLLNQPADVIHDLVFTPIDDLPDDVERLPLKVIHGNHVPMLAPIGTLNGVDTDRIGLDPERCKQHARLLLASLESVRKKVIDVFTTPREAYSEGSDADRMLYSGGFFSAADQHLMKKILQVPPDQLGSHLWSFQDTRLPSMLFRYRARNYPDTLSMKEADFWEQDRRERLVESTDPDYFTLSNFKTVMQELREQRKDEPLSLRILDKLDAWVIESGIRNL
jgi:exodeoxyribonuclease I